jgi:hypothetical protein
MTPFIVARIGHWTSLLIQAPGNFIRDLENWGIVSPGVGLEKFLTSGIRTFSSPRLTFLNFQRILWNFWGAKIPLKSFSGASRRKYAQIVFDRAMSIG